MATTVTRTVKPSGGDYLTLSAWEAGQQGDIVTADEIRQAECYSMSDTTTVAIDGWTTDATRYIKVYTPAAERHDGKWNTNKYYLTATLYNYENYTRTEGLQATAGDGVFRNDGTNTIFSACIAKNSTGSKVSGSNRGFLISGGSADLFNCISYDFGDSVESRWVAGYPSVNIYNCTAHNSTVGFSVTQGTVKLVNSIMRSCTTGAQGTFIAGTDYNATDNSSIGYTVTGGGNTHDRVSQTFTFTDEANDNFHLTSSDAGARDFGVSNPGSGLFSDDIDGETRSGTWDIGADEYVAAGGDPEGSLIGGKLIKGGLLQHGVLVGR